MLAYVFNVSPFRGRRTVKTGLALFIGKLAVVEISILD